MKKTLIIFGLCLTALALSVTSCSKKGDDSPKTAIVTFNANGGSFVQHKGSKLDTTVNVGDYLSRPEDPVRADYEFDGWYTEPQCENLWLFYVYPVQETMTLYAKWTKEGERGIIKSVDLGLPSGLKWGSMNLGADVEGDYGDWYAWGELKPYYIDNCPRGDWAPRTDWISGAGNKDFGAGYAWISYSTGASSIFAEWVPNAPYDADSILRTGCDVVQQDLVARQGDGWRMPRAEEWKELFDGTTHERAEATTATGDAVYGIRFYNSKDHSKSIFIPLAGYYEKTAVQSYNTSGRYWSSTWCGLDEPGKAFSAYMDVNQVGITLGDRFMGYPIRPVYILSPTGFMVTTFDAGGINETGATLGGSVSEASSTHAVEYGIVLQSKQSWTEYLSSGSKLRFYVDVTGLDPGVSYTFKAFARDVKGNTTYGATKSFMTTPVGGTYGDGTGKYNPNGDTSHWFD